MFNTNNLLQPLVNEAIIYLAAQYLDVEKVNDEANELNKWNDRPTYEQACPAANFGCRKEGL